MKGFTAPCIFEFSPKGSVILFSKLDRKAVLTALLGSAILAFGLYNVHALSQVTEGGGLGLTLLLHHWFSISPSISSFVFNALCYFLGWKLMGGGFILYSIISSAGFSVFYAICEQFPPVWPEIANHPLLAAFVGALFVGVGCGLCVRIGAAPTGDDALAMSLSRLFHLPIERIYLVSDLIVLGLSASYIPLVRLSYSLLTVILSGQLVGYIERFRMKKD